MDPDDRMPENAKEMINNLLWMILPPHATLEEAEDIALDIYRKVVDRWAGNKSKGGGAA